MASTYSNLKIQLMTTGENTTTWGNVTNINMGTALEEAIAGTADVAFSSANVTLTLTDVNTTQTARNMRLNLTGTATAGYNLIVPAIEKAYIINNATDGTITVKNATGTGIAIPAGKTTWVFNNATNVVDVVTHLTSLTLATALPVASGGTGSNLTTYCNLQANVSGILPTANGGTGSNLATYCNLQSNVSGILPLVNGGTGANTAATARTALGATTVGGNVFTLTNPSAVTFPRFNADNTVSALDAASFRTAIGAGTGTGTVTSVATSGSTNGLSLTGGTITSTGTITLSGSVTSVATTATIDGVVIGYRSIPRSTTTTTAVVGDVGKCIAVSAGITIPNSTFAAGDAISIYNDSASAITITAGVTTLRQAGTANTGNRTLAARGMATVWFNSATEAIISGAGVT
jgi:hypothetical protein